MLSPLYTGMTLWLFFSTIISAYFFERTRMADEDQDDSQKTEDPSQKRLEEAHQKGQVITSREVNSFLMLLVMALILVWMVPYIFKNTILYFSQFITNVDQFQISKSTSLEISANALKEALSLMAVPGIITIIVILLSGFIQHGFSFSFESIMPDLSKISIIKGFGRLFSAKNFVEFLKGIVKICIIGIVSFIAVYPELNKLSIITSYSLSGIFTFLGTLVVRIMVGICAIMMFIAVVDYLFQRQQFLKSLRMSKRDLKDEFKQTQGSPEIKQRLREIRNERSRKRMMKSVPKADAVITNPTHYAVALKYDPGKTTAPIVVAKGIDFLALRIREVAVEHKVPIIENPPLARALYNSVEIDQEVPIEHYKAVAEVIRYVYKIKGKLPQRKARI